MTFLGYMFQDFAKDMFDHVDPEIGVSLFFPLPLSFSLSLSHSHSLSLILTLSRTPFVTTSVLEGVSLIFCEQLN